jgi:homogentisate 1,2-dioxygenase
MPFYQRNGTLPAKRYTMLRSPSGGLYHEELLGAQGFIGESSVLYHVHPPTTILRIEHPSECTLEAWDGISQNLLFDPRLLSAGGDVLTGRAPLFFNDDLTYSIVKPTEPTTGFYRNGATDEVVTIVVGSGVLETTFGNIEYRRRDIIVVPRGTTVRWDPHPGEQQYAVLESRRPIAPPSRYRSPAGQLLDGAPYHERDIRTPVLAPAKESEGEYPILIKSGGKAARYVLDHHPFDVVGWDGYYYPYCLNMEDFEPLSGRVHLLPDKYEVLSAERIAVCLVVPHHNADHAHASPAQAHHMNLDYDEIFFRFETANTSEPSGGTVTLHPRCLTHGPKPGYEDVARPESLETWGLIVDAALPLTPTMQAMEVRDETYSDSWLGEGCHREIGA